MMKQRSKLLQLDTTPIHTVYSVQVVYSMDRDFITHWFKDNDRMVHSISHRFRKRIPNYDYNDLYQETCIGILEGFNTYDPEKGCKLTTWLWVYARDHLNQIVKKHNAIKRSKYGTTSLFSSCTTYQETEAIESQLIDILPAETSHHIDDIIMLTQAIDTLTGVDKEVMDYFLLGLTPLKIADKMNITPSAIYLRLEKIVMRLRLVMEGSH